MQNHAIITFSGRKGKKKIKTPYRDKGMTFASGKGVSHHFANSPLRIVMLACFPHLILSVSLSNTQSRSLSSEEGRNIKTDRKEDGCKRNI